MTWNPRSGPLTDFWAALPTPYKVLATDMSTNIVANFNALQADLYAGYTAYSPALGSLSGTTPTLGSSPTDSGFYKLINGVTCTFHAFWQWGSSPTVGSAVYTMGLPLPWVGDGVPPVFTALWGGSSTNQILVAKMQTASTVVFALGNATANFLDPTHPAAPASGTTLQVSGTYRVG